ncbi:Ribosomal protein S12 methylthiotransferase accessory factor YcaO [Microbacterium lemovicicum]|uniref:Ribosomal protein S12 methylthiotransferase accessory factor YcaO n=1 Tax=Microbacterium lemovicicum TaxID=1072463 RepID=A0A3Q9J1X1_9MICO|nr:TOMM precursor leader peptide-binding protein [Microbacterium lemovicicum]AZS37520.1 Ribosomal protein S12 methylthiotransferase accessory factor YcaO [Microbacterium lemovicicum]
MIAADTPISPRTAVDGSTTVTRWAVDPRISVHPLGETGVVALRGEREIILRGKTFRAILDIAEGRSSDEIAAAIGGRVSAAETYYAIEQLRRRGILVPAEPAPDAGCRALWSELGVQRPGDDPMPTPTITVSETGGVSTDVIAGLADGLEASGCIVRTVSGPPDLAAEAPDLLIVVAGDYTDPAIAEINRRCLQFSVPWMLVWPDAHTPWLGPVFRPGATACWECLMNRRRMHRRLHAVLGADGDPVLMPPLSAPSVSALVGRMAALEAAKAARGIVPSLAHDVPAGAAVLLEMNLADWSSTEHIVVRRPQCPECGDPSPRAMQQIRLDAERPREGDDGGTRTLDADETFRRLRHHVSAITGAVSLLEKQPVPFPGVHVWYSGINVALAPEDLLDLDVTVRSVTAGKGTTAEQARVGALAEALERYSASRHGDELVVCGSLNSLHGRAIHPNDAMLFSERQFADAEAHGSPDSWFNRVPAPFDPDATLEWTPIWSLTHDREFLLPTDYLYMGRRDAASIGLMSDSNGCAAGNTVTEAVLQGFYELVERDAVAIWWYNRLNRPGVDLASFGDPWIDDMVASYRARGREIWALDLTTDLGIPVFVALSRREGHDVEAILLGFGAHLDPRIALLRALSEVNQMSPVDERLGDGEQGLDRELRTWLNDATLASQPYLVPDPDAPVWSAFDHPSSTGGDLADDVLTCRTAVERAGMAVYVIDQTRPDIGLSVVRVVVPGLRPFWSRYAPGRLYDVPVALGWLGQAVDEGDLNPIPFFL